MAINPLLQVANAADLQRAGGTVAETRERFRLLMLQRSIARWITKAIAAGSHRTGFTTLLTPGRCIRALPHVITLATRMRGLVRSLRTHDPTPYSEALERLLETALDAATQLQASSEGLDQVERNLQAIATIFQETVIAALREQCETHRHQLPDHPPPLAEPQPTPPASTEGLRQRVWSRLKKTCTAVYTNTMRAPQNIQNYFTGLWSRNVTTPLYASLPRTVEATVQQLFALMNEGTQRTKEAFHRTIHEQATRALQKVLELLTFTSANWAVGKLFQLLIDLITDVILQTAMPSATEEERANYQYMLGWTLFIIYWSLIIAAYTAEATAWNAKCRRNAEAAQATQELLIPVLNQLSTVQGLSTQVLEKLRNSLVQAGHLVRLDLQASINQFDRRCRELHWPTRQ